jgi:hypothetical protein
LGVAARFGSAAARTGGEVATDRAAAATVIRRSRLMMTFTRARRPRFNRGPIIGVPTMMSFRRLFMSLCVLSMARATLAAPAPAPGPATAPATRPTVWIARVTHEPRQPKSGQAVHVTAAIAPGVTKVRLAYQVVEPGQYVELKDAAYKTHWTMIDMRQGADPKLHTTYEADLPAELQKHRRLIRYRLLATDAEGKAVQSPTFPATAAGPGKAARPEAPSNYAYYVYDGVPPWTAAINPKGDEKQRATTTFSAEALTRAQVYQLIGKRQSVENVTWKEQQGGRDYKYTGTLVTPDGVAHDHVRFRARGGVWRFAMGKNMWKIDLPPGDRAAERDDFGRPYKGGVTKFNLQSCIQQGGYGRRGEQGMYESVGYALMNLAGVEAPRTHFVHWRIVDDADESPKDQYQGDFWGLYLAVENEDGRFLKDHDLPDGNLFKMAGGSGELNHNGESEPADKSDLNAFLNAYNSKDQSEQWWREHLDLPRYYSYRAILECIHHYDIGDGKNYDYYRNPDTGLWQTIPWDLDLTWADHMFGGGGEPFKDRVLSKPALRREYQNRLREIRDLLFNEEQTGALIDEYAGILADLPSRATTSRAPATRFADAQKVSPIPPQESLFEADRRKWDFHPALAGGGQAGHGLFYQAGKTKDFAGMLQLMRDYVRSRGQWVDQTLLNDPKIPATPTVKDLSEKSHPADRLRFAAGAYQGADAFAGARVRIAEVTPTDAPPPGAGPRAQRHYEITPTWESEELSKLEELTIPAGVAKAGHTYRVRVRVKDAENRASHWSAPIEFTATEK